MRKNSKKSREESKYLSCICRYLPTKIAKLMIKFFCFIKYPKNYKYVREKFIQEIFNNNSCEIIVNIENNESYKELYIDGLNIEFSGKDNNNNFIIINCSSKKELEKVRFVNFKLLLKGANNKIEINAPIFFTSNKWEILGNSFISIKSSKYSIGGVYISCKNSSLEIDEDFSSTNRCTIGLAGTKGTNIKIGRDCMFASDISLLSTDFHKIYDNTTGKVLNIPEMGIKIGNHVWVGSGVRILKDTEVGNNIVIGTGTVLTKTFHDDNVIIAGNPGKIVKRNVNWGRELPDDTFENYQKNVAILRNK